MINATFIRGLAKAIGLASKAPEHWPDVEWRPAADSDWPPAEKLTSDLDWMRKSGTGWSADFNGKRWFLFDRDWFGWPDPPEWGLASFEHDDGWRFYDDFDVLPKNWSVPKASHVKD